MIGGLHLELYRRLLWEEGVRNHRGQCVGQEVCEAAVPRVLYLAHGLQLVVDRLYHGAFAEQYLVFQLDQGVFHVVLDASDQMDAVDEEDFRKLF